MHWTTTELNPWVRNWVEVSAARLAGNFRALAEWCGADVEVLAVIKADAYGHGGEACAGALARAGAKWLGVTSVEEGVQIRLAMERDGIDDADQPRVLVMCGVLEGEAGQILRSRLTPVIWESYQVELLEQAVVGAKEPLAVHVEVDTGMSRQGVAVGGLEALLERIAKSGKLRVAGVMTHMASAEKVADAQNAEQMAEFAKVVAQVGAGVEFMSVGNSAGVAGGVMLGELMALAKSVGARAMVRPGLSLYGYVPELEGASAAGLRVERVLEWKTRVVSVRELQAGDAVGYDATFRAPKAMKVALLPVGYADGLRRELSGSGGAAGGWVLVRGRRAAIVGRVSMDLTVVDITGVDVSVGDEVCLIGKQGNENVTAEDHARIAGTIVWEILCGISDRVPRLRV